MSYDLMVFEKTKAPGTRKAFMAWFEVQAEWGEDHDYRTVSVASPALRSWFMEMKDSFPPMNGEFAPDDALYDEMGSYVTDYSIGRDMIYAAFSWPVAEEAYALARDLARKHGAGFFDVSGGGSIILPDGTMIE